MARTSRTDRVFAFRPSRALSPTPATPLRQLFAMDDDQDFIEVRCGRCGKPLRVRLDDIREAFTVDCDACRQPQVTTLDALRPHVGTHKLATPH